MTAAQTSRGSELARRAAARAAHLRGDVALLALDTLCVVASFAAVLLLHHDGVVPHQEWGALLRFLPVAAAVVLAVGVSRGLYGNVWQHAGIQEARQLLVAGTLSVVLLVIVGAVAAGGLPVGVIALACVLSTGLQGLLRFQSRLFAYRRRRTSAAASRLLVLGAGEAGAALVADMLAHPDAGLVPVGLLDDDLRTHGRRVHGIKVLGAIWELPRLAVEQDADQAVLAVADAPQEVVALVSDLCRDAGLALRLLPTRAELVGAVTLKDVRDVRIDDVLGRTQITTDLDQVRRLLTGRRVLITGAGGSIGSEIARQVAQCSPASLLLLDHDETHLHDTAATLDDGAVQLLCDIRQPRVLQSAFLQHRPQVVFHAAAHKHVPLLEDFPAEAVKTNVAGTQNVVDAAVLVGVERLVFISTDKAVEPSSVMGATKAIGEQVVLRAGGDSRRFSAVRFGNVLGSRGSVIPTFVRQIQAGGPVTVTDTRMTRFFMSIPEAVQLVLQAAALSDGGEVFMLEMGEPVRILDLAQRMIELSGRRVGTDVEIRVTGLRPGEKLEEALHTSEETPEPTAHPSIVRLRPAALTTPVLRHEVSELVRAAEEGHDEVVRASVFLIATRRARRRYRIPASETEARRVVDLVQDERNRVQWTHSTT